MRAPRVNDMITSNAGRHAMYRRREQKNVGVGVVKVAPERIESFAESSREIRRAEQQRDEKVEEKGWGERDSRLAASLLARAQGRRKRVVEGMRVEGEWVNCKTRSSVFLS